MNLETLWSQIELTEFCWLWKGSTNNSGYSSVWVPRFQRKEQVYRVVYQILVGPIPPEMELDHLCLNKPCVRPDHFEPVSVSLNRIRAKGDYCLRGHKLAGDNLHLEPYTGGYFRRCRACAAARARKYRRE